MDRTLKIAVIGLGRRATHLVSVLQQVYPKLKITAVADPDTRRVVRSLREARLECDELQLFEDADRLLEHADSFDGIMIGSRCNLHTPLAVKVAETDLPLYLEKPVAISYEQIIELSRAYRNRENSVIVSFPLRLSPLFTSVLEVVRSGRIGPINQVQAVNNVPYGGVYYSQPYRDYDITGGLWLQKATHDFDYINQILGHPVRITAMMGQKIYGGDMPHDLWCSSCDKAEETCMESPQGVIRRNDHGGVGESDHPCVFGNRIKNQDCGSALILYDDGTHASYTQNMVSRRSAARRGAIITGYKATVSFDIYTNSINIVDHHKERIDRIEIKSGNRHSGGDERLARNFVNVCLGRDESLSNLTAGLLSALLCLDARESAHRQTWLSTGDIHIDEFPQTPTTRHSIPRDIEPVGFSRR